MKEHMCLCKVSYRNISSFPVAPLLDSYLESLLLDQAAQNRLEKEASKIKLQLKTKHTLPIPPSRHTPFLKVSHRSSLL